jgi:signal transduction histidine kinase
MGLAKALRWIETAGGSLRLESKPNRGTRAIVVLPAAEAESARPPAQRAAT